LRASAAITGKCASAFIKAKRFYLREPPPNFTLKLVRPGFGPAAELPTSSPNATASRRLQIGRRCNATSRRQPPRRFGFGTRNRPHSLA
jgi:hypothetical protein